MKKKRKWERLLSLVLAVVLIFSSVPESALAATFGLVENKETETTVEPVTETETMTEVESEITTEAEPESETESEIVEPESEIVEPESGSEPESEIVEPESEMESEISEPESESETAAETGPEPQTEIKSETETEAQAVTAEQDVDGTALEVSYPEDAFEEEVTLEAKAVTEDDEQYDAMKKALDELQEKNESFTYDEALIFDIAFVNVDGEKAEPSKDVSVSMKLDAEKIPENVESAVLVHLPDDGEAELVEDAQFSGDFTEVTFQSDDFSMYIAAMKVAEAETEEVKEAVSENESETEVEEVTEAASENESEVETEEMTEAVSENESETEVEEVTEVASENESEIETEEMTEAVSEAEPETEVEEVTEAASETETEIETEEMTEAVSENESEVETEEVTEAVSEAESEIETEIEIVEEEETETEAETEIIRNVKGSILQNVFQQENAEGKKEVFIKYEISVKNLDAENAVDGVNVQALLSENVTLTAGEDDTEGMETYEALSEIPDPENLSQWHQEIYAETQAVQWQGQTLAAGETKIYRFTVKVAEGVTDTADLKSAFYVDGKIVGGSYWKNMGQLVVQEEEEEPKTDFMYENDLVSITATAQPEANFPQDTQLKAKYLPQGSEGYESAVAAIESQMGDEDTEFLEFVMYDVYFMSDGKKIEPADGTVEVTMKYKQPILGDTAEEADEIRTYHIDEQTNVVEDITDVIKTNTDGEVKKIKFELGSFSTVVSVTVHRNSMYGHGRDSGSIGYEWFKTNGGYSFGTSSPSWGTQPFTLTVTYRENDGSTHTEDVVAYCLQADINSPQNDRSTADVEQSDFGSAALNKILYYGYGGRGFRTSVNGQTPEKKLQSLIKTAGYNIGTGNHALTGSGTNHRDYNDKLAMFEYVLTHVAASYQYYKDKGNSNDTAKSKAGTGVVNEKRGWTLAENWWTYLSGLDVPNFPQMKVLDKETNASSEGKTYTLPPNKTFSIEETYVNYSLPEGLLCNGVQNGKINSGTNMTFSVKNGLGSGGSHTVSVTGPKGMVAAIVSGYKEGGKNYQALGASVYSEKEITINFTLKWNAATVNIHKQDVLGRPVSGVKFNIYAGDGTTYIGQTNATDASGNVSATFRISTEVNNYDYVILREVQSTLTEDNVIQYKENQNQSVEAYYRNAGTTTTVTNDIKNVNAKLNFTKKSDFAANVADINFAGAEYTVYAADKNTKITTLTTDASGNVTQALWGNAGIRVTDPLVSDALKGDGKITVWLKETKAPTNGGYALNNEWIEVKDVQLYSVDGTERVTNVTLSGEQIETITKTKVTKKLVAPDGTPRLSWEEGTSAVFEIHNAAGKVSLKPQDGINKDSQIVLSKAVPEVMIYGLPAGTYTLKEISAPAGYKLAPEVEFTVSDTPNASGTVEVVDATATDTQTLVKINKIAVYGDTNTRLAGAEFSLKEGKGDEKTYTITSSADSDWELEGLLVDMQYTLTETKAPDGYTIADPVTFWIDVDGTVYFGEVGSKDNPAAGGIVSMIDTPTEAKFAKVDKSEPPEFIPGATLAIKYADGEKKGQTVDLSEIQGNSDTIGIKEYDYKKELQWNSLETPVTVYGLPAGNYELVEVEAPAGYVRNQKSVPFTVDQNKDSEAVITKIADQKTEAEIEKIFNPDGTTFRKEGENLNFALEDGQIIEFELRLKGTSKETELTEVEPVHSGNTVVYTYDFAGSKVEKLRTKVTLKKGESRIKLIGLPAGTYKVKEISAPAGFILQTCDLVVNGETDQEGNLIQPKVKEITNVATEIKIGKKGILSDSDAEEEKGGYIAGAKLQILEKSSGKVASNVYGESLEWTTTDKPVTINGLAPGKKYILHEAETPKDESGNRTWILAEDIEFTVEIDADGKTTISPHEGEETNLLVMRDYQTKVEIEKYSFVNGIDEKKGIIPQRGAELAVYKGRYDKTTDFKKMEDVKIWTSESDRSSWVIKGLELDTVYTLAELSAPTGYTLADPIVFKIEDKHNKTRNRDSDDGGEVYILASQNESGMEKQFLAESWVRAEVDGTKDKIRMVNSLYEMRFTKVTEDGDHMDTVTLAITRDSEGKDVVTLENAYYPHGDKPEAGEPNGYLLFNVQANNGSYYPVYGLEPGDYYLVEESSPLGFVKAKPMKFTVAANQKATEPVVIKTLTNYETRIRIEKKLERFNEYVPKAEDRFVFKLTPVEIKDNMNPGVTVEERMKEALGEDCQIVIDPNTAEKSGEGYLSDEIYGLPAGKYRLYEVEVPNGYEMLREGEDEKEITIDFEVTYSRNENVTVVPVQTIGVNNATTKIAFAKVDENGNPLSGANLHVIDLADGSIATTIFYKSESRTWGEKLRWESDGTVKVFTGLPKGHYMLEESYAPRGRVYADDIEFWVDDTGRVTTEGGSTCTKVDGTQVVTLTMVDDRTEVRVAKEFENGYRMKAGESVVLKIRPVSGPGDTREITLTELNWNETEKKYISNIIYGLAAGDYFLEEVSAPEGFTIAERKQFTISDRRVDGEIVAEMPVISNTATEIEISKRSVTTADTELPGAHLQVLDEDGNIAKTVYGEELKWTSGTTSKVIKGLKPGTYTLHEEAAPTGYAYSADIKFTIPENMTSEVQLDKVVMEDKVLDLHVTKVDVATDEELAGAKLTLLKRNADDTEEEIESWTSNGEDSHDFGPLLEAGERYILREEAAPQGYAFTADQEFHVEEDGTITTDMRTAEDEDGNTVYLVDDTAIEMHVTKVDVETDEELAGAKLTLLKKNADDTEEEIESWTSNGEDSHDFGPLLEANGDYILREEAAPQGYAFTADQEFHVEEDGTITTDDMRTAEDEDGNTVYLVDDQALRMPVKKVDVSKDEELAGAKLTVLKKNADGTETAVDSWTSDGETSHDFGPVLEAGGDYILREEAAPRGYDFVADQEFHVNENGTITTGMKTVEDEDGSTIYLVDDTAIVMYVTKADAATDEELAGATLTVLKKDADGTETVVDSWTSNGESAHDFGPMLDADMDYILREEAAPGGYAFTSDQEFRVEKDGSITAGMRTTTDEDGNTIYLVDDQALRMPVKKVDVSKEEELAGAKLTVLKKNADGTETAVDSWTSDGETSHDFGPVLEAGGDYILREEAAPRGYDFVADQEFHVNEDGTITTGMKTAEDEDGSTIYLVDDTAIVMYVTKVDAATDAELAGATLTVLKKNADGTETVVDRWTSDGVTPHNFGLMLDADMDYILREEAAPQGYAFTSDQEFHVNKDGTITASMRTTTDEEGNTVYLMDDTAIELHVTKVDVETGAELAGATLTVLRRNADGTETVVDRWVSDGVTSHDFGPLLEANADYILREEAAPQGYGFVADQEFHVNNDGTITTSMRTAVDEDGNTVYLVEDRAIELHVTKVDVETDEELAGATLTVLRRNADGTETVVDRWVSDGVTSHDFGPLLEANADYILREEAAPQGYGFVADQEFHVNNDGTITTSMRTAVDEDGNTVYLVEDRAIELHVTKVDVETEEELAGATLTVLRRNADGTETVVDRWMSDGVTSHDFGPLLEANGDYILREEAAPQGYGFVADQEFHVNNDGTITTSMRTAVDEDGNTVYLVEDRAIELHVTKVDVETDEELAGATLTVLRRNADGTETVVDRWVSDGVTSHDFGPLLEANGDYILREEAAPQGYGFVADQEFHVNNDGTITTSMRTAVDEDGNTVYLVEDRAIELHVTKVDVETDEELAGATLTVLRRNADGTETVVDRWVSDGVTSHDFGPLLEANADYILREEAAPDGYAFTSDQEFHVNNDGTITTSMRTTVDEDGNTVYLVDDRALHMIVNKVDVSSQEELAGAELTLYLMEGDELTEVDRWTSVIGETHDFGPALKAGGTYLLRETVAPDGYKYTSDITFEVAQDGTIRTTMNRTADENGNTIYLVEDEATRAEIEKIDAETREPLAGAHLQITDEDGTVVEEWISDGTPHIVEAKLSIGKTYTLTETEAPEFYELAEPVIFTVAQDGTIPNIVMEDTRVTGARIAVTKTLTYNGDPVNAVDETFYVALFEDEERTRRVSDVKAVEFRNASSSTVEFDDLEPGKTYYIGETDEDGVLLEAGTLGDGTVYEAHFNEGYEAVVEQEDGTVQVRFENELLDVPGPEYYLDAELSVTKKLVGADGLPMKSSDTFYAGIFEDAEHTKLSDKVSQNIVPLALGGDSTVTETVSVSLMPDEELKLYVTEVTEDGTPVRTGSGFEYDFLVEDGEVTLNEEHTSAATTITNSPALPVHPYNVGELTITKRLLGADGYEMASTEVFYAGIFDDAEHTQLSERVSENIVQLALNGNSRATATVEVSMASDETATLYVTEVYEDGTPVEKSASFQYEVSVEGAVLEMTNNTAGETTITNREKGGEQETEGGNDETEKPDENGNGGGNNSGGGGDNYVPQTSVKTGDETPVWLYLGIFLAAAAVLAVLFFERRRRVRK